MTQDVTPEKRQTTMQPLDPEVDHVRGASAGRLIVEYGDYECPYSRQAFRQIERVEQRLSGGIRFAFRLPDSERIGFVAVFPEPVVPEVD